MMKDVVSDLWDSDSFEKVDHIIQLIAEFVPAELVLS